MKHEHEQDNLFPGFKWGQISRKKWKNLRISDPLLILRNVHFFIELLASTWCILYALDDTLSMNILLVPT